MHTTDDGPAPPAPTTPERHAYVKWEGTRWRTCRRCGQGANADVHRIEEA